jgi:hypothetical protein
MSHLVKTKSKSALRRKTNHGKILKNHEVNREVTNSGVND